MAEPKRLNAARALARPGTPMPPAVAEILEGLLVQQAVPPEMLPAIAEVLGYVYQMDDVAEKRKQIQRR
jgi:flagellar biosynthesis protein FlhB